MVDAPSFVSVPVLDSWDETALLRGLRLDLGSIGELHRVPGQVVRLRPRSANSEPEKDGYFAIANAPVKGPTELLVKRGSPISDAVIAHAQKGAALEATAPFGRGFPIDQARGKNLFLFAAGSGITPLRAVIQHVVAARSDFGNVTLFYGQRHEDDFAYRNEHRGWQEAGIDLLLCCSQPSAEWHGPRGYVQAAAGAHSSLSAGAQTAVAFLCGPKAMVTDAREMLSKIGIENDRTFLNF